jgi:hypothetical protein
VSRVSRIEQHEFTNGSTDMNTSFRLSRIASPRATLWSIILLVAACFAFGLTASAAVPADALGTQPLLAEGPLGQLLCLIGRG